MTGLRDARLHKALESAPDGDLRPAERVRREILAKAHQAVAPAPAARATPWWKALWESAGRRNSPWNAAFATLVIAGFVTVLWFDREVPGPQPETTQADGRVPSAAAPAPPVPAAAPAPATAPAAPTAPAPAPAPAQVKPAKPAADAATRAAPTPPAEMAQARKSEPALSARQSGPAQDAAGGGEPARERRADTKSLRDEDTRAVAKSAQPQAESAAPATAPLQESIGAAAGTAAAPRAAAPMARSAAPVQAAPAAQAPAPAPALAPASVPAPAPVPQRDATASGWTHAKVSIGGRDVEVERSQAGRLAALLGAIERGPRGEEPLEGPVGLKIELSEQGAPVDVLEVVGTQVRWARLRAGQRSGFIAKPEPAQLQALQAEVNRLAGR